jgi:phage-related minor tail protein
MGTGEVMSAAQVAAAAAVGATRIAVDADDFFDALAKIAQGRTDNGRPLGGEDARQIARQVLISRGYDWSKEPKE